MSRLPPNALAALYMSISMLAFALNDATMKFVSASLPLFQMVLVRGAMAAALIFAFAAWKGALRPRIDRQGALIIGARVGSEIGASLMFLMALTTMPIANATAVLQILPLAVTLGAWKVFGERLGRRRLTAIAVGFLGMAIIVRPGPEGFDLNALWAVGAVCFLVVRDLATRALPADMPGAFVTLCTALGMLCAGAVGAALTPWTPVEAGPLSLLLLAACLVLGGYHFGVETMRLGDVAAAAPFRYTILLWSMLAGAVVFGEVPDALSLLGAAIVVGAGVYAVRREQALAEAEGPGHDAADLGGVVATAPDGRAGVTPPPPHRAD